MGESDDRIDGAGKNQRPQCLEKRRDLIDED